MMMSLLVWMNLLMLGHLPHVDSAYQCRLVTSWSSAHASYGATQDPVSKNMYFTRDVKGVPTLFVASDLSSMPQVCNLRGGDQSSALGCVTFANNGDAFGVTYVMGSRQTRATIVQLYRSSDTIVIGAPVPSLLADVFTSFPTISPDGQLMVFVTDRPGSIGSTDLWQAERQIDGSFGQPLHCGNAVNSPFAETTPDRKSVV